MIPAEEAGGEVDEQPGAHAGVVEEGVQFDEVERADDPGIVKRFHHQMGFAIGETAGDGRADAGSDCGVHGVDVEAQMQMAVGGGDLFDQAADRRGGALLVDHPHIDDVDAARFEQARVRRHRSSGRRTG